MLRSPSTPRGPVKGRGEPKGRSIHIPQSYHVPHNICHIPLVDIYHLYTTRSTLYSFDSQFPNTQLHILLLVIYLLLFICFIVGHIIVFIRLTNWCLLLDCLTYYYCCCLLFDYFDSQFPNTQLHILLTALQGLFATCDGQVSSHQHDGKQPSK